MSVRDPLFFPLVSSSQQIPSQVIDGLERQIGPTYSTLPKTDLVVIDITEKPVQIYYQISNSKFIHATNNPYHQEVSLEAIYMPNRRDMCLSRLLDHSALFLQPTLYRSATPGFATSEIEHLQSFEAMLFDSLHKRRNELIGVLSDSRIIYSPATRRNTEKREEDERLGEGRFDDLFRDIRME